MVGSGWGGGGGGGVRGGLQYAMEKLGLVRGCEGVRGCGGLGVGG